MLFDVVFIFPETTLLSLLKGDWDLALPLLDESDCGVRGTMFIGAVYHGTHVLVKKNQFLSQVFVEAHGGRITATSEGVGMGTAVLVCDRFSGQSCAISHDCPEMMLYVEDSG